MLTKSPSVHQLYCSEQSGCVSFTLVLSIFGKKSSRDIQPYDMTTRIGNLARKRNKLEPSSRRADGDRSLKERILDTPTMQHTTKRLRAKSWIQLATC